MPGNEVGDRVHNFFAQDNLSHSQHHSQVSGGNWAVPNKNLWVGSQRQIDVLSSNLKDYNPEQSAFTDLERGHISHSQQVQHGLNLKHPSLRPVLTRSQSHNQHPNLNGAIYGRQVFQTRPGEANFLGVDTESDRNDLMERGLSIYEPSQGSGPNRLESLESPVSFDLFGGQQQMINQHPGVLLSLLHQQSGFGEMQQLQQQFMLRKMQELQKQKDLCQLDSRQQNSVNQVQFLTRQTSGNHSHALVNSTPISDASNYSWATELTAGNTKWLQHASPAMQGSSSGHVFSPGQGQSSHSVGLVHQQVDQSLHGVPVSNSRGSSNQYPHIAADKSPQHMLTYSDSFQGNHYTVFPEQVSMQDGTLIDRPGFQGKNLFGHTFNQGVNSGINMESLQRLNPPERNVPLQEFQGRQERDSPSEILREKMAVQATSSQNSVALDPTEEKILFGSDDDSIWDAFGRNTNMSGGANNLLDGTGFTNGFPSIQSGSWSALMQSAVAETSSSDVGLQEEWAGLSFQNPGLPAGNHQPSSCNDTGKNQTALANTNLQISSAFSFGSVPPSDDANLKNNYHTVQGFQWFGHNISQENGERLQKNSSQRLIQQSPQAGGSEWLNHGSHIYGNASHSVDSNITGQNILSNWTPQQSGSSQLPNKSNNWSATESMTTGGVHENEKSIQTSQNNDLNRVLHEKLSKKNGVLKVNSMTNSIVELEQLRSTMGTPQLNSEESSLNNAAAVTNLSNARAGQETSQFLPNSHHLNNWKHVDTSVKFKGSNCSGKLQHPFNNGPQLVESSLNSSEKEEIKRHETDSFNKMENHNDSYRSNVSHHTSAAGLRENVLSDASDSQSLAGGKQKSSNQVGRKISGLRKFQYHPMGNLDEDVEPSYRTRQATHSHSMHLHKSEGFKSQHQELFGQSKHFDQIPTNSSETGKGQLPDRQRYTKGLDEVASRDIPPGYGSSTSSPLDRSVGMITSNKASHTSQNMLELLHKVDQLEERGVVMHLRPSKRNPLSETTKSENSNGTGGLLQQNQSSACQGFGLQLAPPSQRLPVSNHVSQRPLQTVNSCTSTPATSDKGDKVQTESSPSTSGQSLPSSHERSQGEFKNNRTVIPGQTACESSVRAIQGNFSSAFNSGFPYSRSQPQDQLMSGARRQGSMNQSIDVPFDRHSLPSKQADDSCNKLTGQSAETSLRDAAGNVPYDNAASSANISHPTALDHLHERAPAAEISAGKELSISQPFNSTGISQQHAFPKKIPNIWTNVPAQQQFLRAQARQVQPKLSQPHQSDIVKSTSSVQRSLEDLGAKMRTNIPSELGAGSVHSQGFVCGEEQLMEENPCQLASSVNIDLVQKMNESQRKGAIIQHLPNASPSNSASTQREIEAFGRSLKPNNFFHQNYSLLNQMRAMKNVETDPSDRGLKRLKGSNTILVGEQVVSKSRQAKEYNAMVGEALVSCSSVPSGDPLKIVSFSESDDCLERDASSSLLGNVPSQDVLMFNQNGNNTASVRIEQSKISPQMAPSWFNQYGTFKNEQMLQMYDARKANIVKSVEQPFALEKSSSSLHTLNSVEHVNAAADTSQIGHNRQGSTAVSLAIENCSLPQSLPPDNVGQQFGVLRPKKRKKATSELQSWNKEVSQGSLNLQTIRMAEADWAKAANRLCEVKDTADMIEDGLPICKAGRRRLILTTQLMQQLFSTPPAVILSAGASLNSETLTYFAARLALGDACSLMSCSKSYSDVHPEGANFQDDNCRTSYGISDPNLSLVMEDFMGRVRKLENDLLRLDKRASVLDLRVECQDVEKFSVMNRFAKFHGRWQTDGAETSSSSNTAVNAQKPFTQKYVTVVALPSNLPDRVQCLSL